MLFIAFAAILGLSSAQYQVHEPHRRDCVTRPGPYGPCSAPCGGGVKTRQIEIVQQHIGYGKKCPEILTETISCNHEPCKVDCKVETGKWGACSATCGNTGYETKTDYIITQPQHGGLECPQPSSLVQRRPCVTPLPACPVPKDCVIGFTQFGECQGTCGVGSQFRHAFVVSPAENGGAPCPDVSQMVDSQQCEIPIPCQSDVQDCQFMFGVWSQCSATCGQGQQYRKMYIVSHPENGGQACPAQQDRVEIRPCQTPLPACPVPTHCKVTFGSWSQCSRSCGLATQSLSAFVTQQPSHGGAPCPDVQQTITRTCNAFQCPQLTGKDCEIVYGDYSACSATCGAGYRWRKGYIVHQGDAGYKQCPAESQLVQRVPCNTQACQIDQDCIIQRAYWTQCDKPCGGGVQTRQLTIVQQSQGNGHPCPASTTETRSCNTQACQQLTPPVYGSRPSLFGF